MWIMVGASVRVREALALRRCDRCRGEPAERAGERDDQADEEVGHLKK